MTWFSFESFVLGLVLGGWLMHWRMTVTLREELDRRIAGRAPLRRLK